MKNAHNQKKRFHGLEVVAASAEIGNKRRHGGFSSRETMQRRVHLPPITSPPGHLHQLRGGTMNITSNLAEPGFKRSRHIFCMPNKKYLPPLQTSLASLSRGVPAVNTSSSSPPFLRRQGEFGQHVEQQRQMHLVFFPLQEGRNHPDAVLDRHPPSELRRRLLFLREPTRLRCSLHVFPPLVASRGELPLTPSDQSLSQLHRIADSFFLWGGGGGG